LQQRQREKALLALVSSHEEGGLSGEVSPVQTAFCSPHKASQDRGAFLSGRTVKQESPPTFFGAVGCAVLAQAERRRKKARLRQIKPRMAGTPPNERTSQGLPALVVGEFEEPINRKVRKDL